MDKANPVFHIFHGLYYNYHWLRMLPWVLLVFFSARSAFP